jgi:hypothetical protein
MKNPPQTRSLEIVKVFYYLILTKLLQKKTRFCLDGRHIKNLYYEQ